MTQTLGAGREINDNEVKWRDMYNELKLNTSLNRNQIKSKRYKTIIDRFLIVAGKKKEIEIQLKNESPSEAT